MVCPFCGVETRQSTGHETQEACIRALQSEVSALRHLLAVTDASFPGRAGAAQQDESRRG